MWQSCCCLIYVGSGWCWHVGGYVVQSTTGFLGEIARRLLSTTLCPALSSSQAFETATDYMYNITQNMVPPKKWTRAEETTPTSSTTRMQHQGLGIKSFFFYDCHTRGHVGAFTERDTLRRFSHWSLFALSRSLSLSLSQLNLLSRDKVTSADSCGKRLPPTRIP